MRALCAPRALLASLLFPAALLALVALAPARARAQSATDSTARVGMAVDYVTDQASVFTDEGRVAIERYCGKVERALDVQFAVVTVPSLGNETIEQYTERQFREWGVGAKKRDEGLLLAIAVREHKIRFEVGYGLEGPLPDMRVGRIIRETLTPAFRAGRYDAGVLDALTQAAAFVAQDKKLPAPVPDGRPVGGGGRDHGIPLGFVLPLIIVAVVARLLSGFGGGGRRRRYGGFLGPWGGGYGGGGFGGGGFGGGFGGGSGSGFGGFGGGGSGGGGASGGW